MNENIKLIRSAVAAPCPELSAATSRSAGTSVSAAFGAAGLSGPAASGIAASRLRGSGVSGSIARQAAASERSERPTQAPAVAVAQAHAYVAANGADNQTRWIDGGFAAATRTQEMRAFRGLEPWRDPA